MSTISRELIAAYLEGEIKTLTNREQKELARIALASLEAEKSILYRERNPYNGLTTGWQELTDDEYEFIKDNAGENAEFRTVYTALPAPVSVPDELTKSLASIAKEYQTTPQNALFIVVGWNAYRATMLQEVI